MTGPESRASPAARSRTGLALAGAAWLLGAHVLLAYGLPWQAFLALALGLGVVCWRVGAAKAWVTTTALLAATLVYGLVLEQSAFEERIFYRPDERFLVFDAARGHLVYESGADLEMDVPHGDLRAMAGPSVQDLAEPRRVRFRTDAHGFRNDRDYHGQRFVLVGDSFVAGTGSSQEDTLAAQMLARHGLDAYSLACPGDMTDYAAFVRGFARRHGDDFRVYLFVFEGNDFERGLGRGDAPVALFRHARAYYEVFSRTSTYRVSRAMLRRFSGASKEAKGSIELAEVAGQRMAFYRPYAVGTREAAASDPGGFERALESMRPYVEHVYFIPTKYRVYAGHLAPGQPLSRARWEYLEALCRKLHLRCTDLTPALVRASDALLAEGRLTWWRDDTHWNREGIAVAADIIAADVAADVAAGDAR